MEEPAPSSRKSKCFIYVFHQFFIIFVPVKPPFLKVVRSGEIASLSTSRLYPLLFEPVTLDLN
ncbi:hypothetical protein DW228_17265 [Bacteroides fragilis]|uniref:Uncharacterized protein n=1 Tax=Bacteroides fragilis TaxID=817 RepID=A0A396BQE4_BACFG|nr:hypothetical protein [Bacteroides fragilis]QLK84206.1 hypothetical protein DBK98_019815 [Bacteroides sp. PHL 2737]QCQ46828.1 hypothetical protein EC80_019355 [Bacteroides fragilis]QCQ49925.1 hypothetical protein EE52_011110 [Bacteroides fragilis]RGN62309.1 hypothetical protein DXB60_10815 [Bacteroides fragilis]